MRLLFILFLLLLGVVTQGARSPMRDGNGNYPIETNDDAYNIEAMTNHKNAPIQINIENRAHSPAHSPSYQILSENEWSK